MIRKNYFTALLAAVLFLLGSITAFAQTAPVTGRVELKKADGTTEPVSGALVEVYRTDIKGKLPSDKTNKKGEFSFAGLPIGATFVFSVSGQGIKPEVRPNVRAGIENLVITVIPGDGKKYTEDEVRQALAGGGGATTDTATMPAAENKELTEEQKKQQAEYEKQVAEITAKNKKIEEQTAAVKKALDEGNQAFNSKNYDIAIVKFEEGYQASPDFVGSAPVLLNNKAAALKIRAVNVYNENVKSSDPSVKGAAMAKVRQDLADAAEAYSKSWAILKSAPTTDITDPKNYESNKINTLSGAKDAFRLMAATEQVDTTQAADVARTLITAYINVETDAAKKAEAQVILGDVFRIAGDFDNAIAEYRKAIEMSPDNPDALAGLGLSLFAAGEAANNTEQKQEGLNYMARFAEVAPDNHKLKADVASVVEYLKSQKLTPQKVKPAPARRRN